MKNFTKPIAVTALFLSCFFVNAQNNDTLDIQRNEKGVIQFAHFLVNASSDRKMKNDTIFLKKILKAKNEDSFHIIKAEIDESGVTHKKFQQYYKGLKVENAQFLIHGKNDNIEVINGDFQNINISNIKPSLTEQQSLAKALIVVSAKKYKWEDAEMEKLVKQNTNNPNATYYPKGELVISKDLLTGSNVFKLSWKFQISSMLPSNEQLIYVDANNGNIINNVPLILDANTSCTAQTSYSGTQSMTGDTYPGGIRLQETRNGVLIQTLNLNNTLNYSSATDFSNSNTNWISGSWPIFTQDQWALDTHWGTEKVLDYWRSVFNRYSVDGDSIRMLGYVHADLNWDNAQWVAGTNNHFMQYGDGYTLFKPLTCLDVVAHETGHGINEFTANLTPGIQESGALNEGFSDIWGASIEYWAAPTKQTWRMGEEIIKVTGYNCLRDIQYPKSTTAKGGPNPDTYHGTYWDYNGEPHCNSTVLSHWFYLLSQGGSGTNDIGHSYSVLGIGIDPAQRIAYRTETAYLFSSSDYTAAMNASISAATDLSNGNANSIRVMQVKNAWYAVGLGTQPTQMSITGPSLLCSSGASYTLNNPATGTLTWTSSANISIVSSQGSNPCIFQEVANSNGSGWIQANFDGIAGPIINVWVGLPVAISSLEGEEVGFPDACTNETLHMTIIDDNVSALTNYIWTLYGATMTYHNSNYSSVFARVSSVPRRYDFQIKASNSCGTLSVQHFYGQVQDCGGGLLAIYPNPASNNVQVSIIKNSNTVSSSDTTGTITQLATDNLNVITTYTVNIYNGFGTLIFSTKKTGDTFNISVGNFKAGSYIIEANDGKQNYSQHLIIKH